MSTRADFEQWAEQHGLSITKHPWYGDIYESEATLYAYMGWEACQKEIDTLKTKLEEFVLLDAYFYGSSVHKKAEKLIEETKLLLESKSMGGK